MLLAFWLSDSHNPAMPAHSVAEARNHLSALIDRARAGETVIITRHGTPVVELTPIAPAPRPVSAADLDFLARHRVGARRPDTDAGTLVSDLRDAEDR